MVPVAATKMVVMMTWRYDGAMASPSGVELRMVVMHVREGCAWSG